MKKQREGHKEAGYDVALSFAGEDRAIASSLASLLQGRGLRVFYDQYEVATLWGSDLYSHFDKVYRRSSFLIPIISRSYLDKSWTLFEWKSSLARSSARVLPVTVDGSGLFENFASLDARKYSLEAIADAIAKVVKASVTPEEGLSPAAEATALHVISREGRWSVKKTGATRSSGIFNTRDEAIAAARELALSQNAKIVLHRADGTVDSMVTPAEGQENG